LRNEFADYFITRVHNILEMDLIRLDIAFVIGIAWLSIPVDDLMRRAR
jgi:hypothetical protein